MAEELEKVGEEDDEEPIEVDYHKDVNGKPPSVNYLDYVGYIKEGGSPDSGGPVSVPHRDSESVKFASEQIPGVTKRQIEHRLELLLLPSSLLNAVDNGTLTKSAARVLVRFRQLGDVDQMHEEMSEYGNKDMYRGDSPDVRSLKGDVDRRIKILQSEKESEDEAIPNVGGWRGRRTGFRLKCDCYGWMVR